MTGSSLKKDEPVFVGHLTPGPSPTNDAAVRGRGKQRRGDEISSFPSALFRGRLTLIANEAARRGLIGFMLSHVQSAKHGENAMTEEQPCIRLC
jgi:hypothetical protein